MAEPARRVERRHPGRRRRRHLRVHLVAEEPDALRVAALGCDVEGARAAYVFSISELERISF